MKKILAISSVLFGVVFLAGCGQQPVSQTQPIKPAPAQSVSTVQKTQLNIKVSELMKLSDPVVCDISLLEKTRAERKTSEGTQVATKLFIKNGTIREEGISIFTDGTEKPSLNIINPSKKSYYSLLLDGSNNMTSLDYDMLGGSQVVAGYDDIPASSINCKIINFDEKLLTPSNVCYMPPSTNQPQCKISN